MDFRAQTANFRGAGLLPLAFELSALARRHARVAQREAVEHDHRVRSTCVAHVLDLERVLSFDERTRQQLDFETPRRFTYYLHNNTIFNINNVAGNGTAHARGIQVNFGTVIARNNLVLNMNAAGGNESFNGAFADSSNNVSFDANAPGGATSRFNQTAYASYFVNINNGLEDLHLLNDSPTMPELVTSRDGTVRALNRRARTAFRGEGLNPSSAARLLEVGFQGEVKKALVELAPLRWDAARGQLLLARRLVVRVSFRTPDPSEEAIRGRRGRRYRRRRSHDERSVTKRLVTVEPGLYAVRYEDVMSGSRSVSTA